MISYLVTLATLPAVVALLLGACQSRKDGDGTGTTAGADSTILIVGDANAAAGLDNDTFRDRMVAFVRQVSQISAGTTAGREQLVCALPLSSKRPFRAVVWLYHEGTQVGRGEATNATLCIALKDATQQAIAAAGIHGEALAGARFAIDLPDHDYSLIEHQDKGIELSHGLVPVRMLDKALLRKRIDEGKAYLLRVLDPERKGVHKYYHAPEDRFEDRLHTIYTASTMFTLLALHARDRDAGLLAHIEGAADFLLSMQLRDPRDRGHGGFYYSLDTTIDQPEPKLVVGTTSKTIFTLLALHALTGNERYLEAATLGANWLLSMQRPDGSVRSYLRQKESGFWASAKKESLLYTGQVLSALSRMYGATRHPKYLDAASLTATYLAGKVAAQGCYLGDDYRKPNPISSSWVVMSLLDYVKVTEDARFQDLVFHCAEDLLGRQIRKGDDVYRHGRWQRSLSSSGNGWLAEVMAELHRYCRAQEMDGCERFESAIVHAFRLLMQHTYAPENAFVVKNPAAAIGGVFWNVSDRYVRTDSVCHAMNAYIYMIDHLGEGPLIQLPEPPLAERLALTP